MWNKSQDNCVQEAIISHLPTLNQDKRVNLLNNIMLRAPKIDKDYLKFEEPAVIQKCLDNFEYKKPKPGIRNYDQTIKAYKKIIKILKKSLLNKAQSDSNCIQSNDNSFSILIKSIDELEDIIENNFLKHITNNTNKIWQDSEIVRDYLKGKCVMLLDNSGEEKSYSLDNPKKMFSIFDKLVRHGLISIAYDMWNKSQKKMCTGSHNKPSTNSRFGSQGKLTERYNTESSKY